MNDTTLYIVIGLGIVAFPFYAYLLAKMTTAGIIAGCVSWIHILPQWPKEDHNGSQDKEAE